MPSPLVRLNPFRNAFLAAAVFLVITVLLTMFSPIPVANAASGLLAPGVYLLRVVGLQPGFISTVLAYYVNFALYAIAFAVIFRVAAKRA